MKCPLCGNHDLLLRKGTMIYCPDYKPQKEGNEWINTGNCDFHIAFNQKAFGKKLTDSEMRKLLEGGDLVNSKGDTMSLDLTQENGFFTTINWAVRPEDKKF